MSAQPTRKNQTKPKEENTRRHKMANDGSRNKEGIPEQELKQNSGVSASMALQAMQKAWDLRQAANAAGDPNAREKILAKAINKEIEAESFGKAAKYTRSGAFQGLAAGAGLGVQPGVTIGKLTGALVGGVISTVTGLLGGGIGSVYGAMNGPFWDLGEMASQGVRGVVGDFPNCKFVLQRVRFTNSSMRLTQFSYIQTMRHILTLPSLQGKSTPSQQKALEKMIMQTSETQAPTKEELEQLKADAPDDMPQSWAQTTKDVTSWRPSMPNMPDMPSMPSMPQGTAFGLGGLGAAMPSWGGQKTTEQNQGQTQNASTQRTAGHISQPSKQATQKPKEASTPKEGPKLDKSQPHPTPAFSKASKPQTTSETKTSTIKLNPNPVKEASHSKATSTPRASPSESKATSAKETPKSQTAKNPLTANHSPKNLVHDGKTDKSLGVAEGERKKPRKIGIKSSEAPPSQVSTPRKAPRKLAGRKPTI